MSELGVRKLSRNLGQIGLIPLWNLGTFRKVVLLEPVFKCSCIVTSLSLDPPETNSMMRF